MNYSCSVDRLTLFFHFVRAEPDYLLWELKNDYLLIMLQVLKLAFLNKFHTNWHMVLRIYTVTLGPSGAYSFLDGNLRQNCDRTNSKLQ